VRPSWDDPFVIGQSLQVRASLYREGDRTGVDRIKVKYYASVTYFRSLQFRPSSDRGGNYGLGLKLTAQILTHRRPVLLFKIASQSFTS